MSMLYDTSCQQRWRDYPSSREKILSVVDWKGVFGSMASQLCREDPGECGAAGRPPLFLTDFVDVQSGTVQKTGVVLSDLMYGSLIRQCCSPVMKGEFDQLFTISEKGRITLIPQADRGADILYPYYEAVFGTYLFTLDRLTLSVRKINVYTGEVTAAAERDIVFTCFHDTIQYSVK